MADVQKAMARRCVEEVWNKGNLAVVDELYSRDFVQNGTADAVRGCECYKESVKAFRGGFSEFHLTIEDLIEEGDKVVTRWSMRGTHDRGEVMGIPPTGRKVELTGITIARVAEEKFVEEWECVDALGLMEQLGAKPPSG